jgi:hypothetical protein
MARKYMEDQCRIFVDYIIGGFGRQIQTWLVHVLMPQASVVSIYGLLRNSAVYQEHTLQQSKSWSRTRQHGFYAIL